MINRRKTFRRPFRFLVYTAITIALAFTLAVVNLGEPTPLLSLVVFIVPLSIFVLSLLTYLDCVINLNGGALFALLVIVSGSFVISASLWFTNPELPRLEPLSTLLALDAAFLGFLTSSSGRGRLSIDLSVEGDADDPTLKINLRLNLRQEGARDESGAA